MNTWLMDIIKDANERLYSDIELERILAYYSTLPNRLRLVEELEKLEGPLPGLVWNRLRQENLDPSITKRTVEDLVEGLRHLGAAILADDLRLLEVRWTQHLMFVVTLNEIPVEQILRVYQVLDDELTSRIPNSLRELYRPAMDSLLDALTTPTTAATSPALT